MFPKSSIPAFTYMGFGLGLARVDTGFSGKKIKEKSLPGGGVYQTDVPIAARNAIYQNLLSNEGSQNAPYTAMVLQAINH
jgi:hypothetical protein